METNLKGIDKPKDRSIVFLIEMIGRRSGDEWKLPESGNYVATQSKEKIKQAGRPDSVTA